MANYFVGIRVDTSDLIGHAADARFADLRLWPDRNQDGISQADELQSLADAGIASISLANTRRNTPLGQGNTLLTEGSFTRTDGTAGQAGELDLATDIFRRRFADAIPLTDEAAALPDMPGAGAVRDLRQAASLDSAAGRNLEAQLADFAAQTTRAGQRARINELISAWAATSGMRPMDERVVGLNLLDQFQSVPGGQQPVPQSDGSVAGGLAQARQFGVFQSNVDLARLYSLEAFNGQYFTELPGDDRIEGGRANQGASYGVMYSTTWSVAIPDYDGDGTLIGYHSESRSLARTGVRFTLNSEQLRLLDEAYRALDDSIYTALVMQTRLKPYLDAIESKTDDTGTRLDASALHDDRDTNDERIGHEVLGYESIVEWGQRDGQFENVLERHGDIDDQSLRFSRQNDQVVRDAFDRSDPDRRFQRRVAGRRTAARRHAPRSGRWGGAETVPDEPETTSITWARSVLTATSEARRGVGV